MRSLIQAADASNLTRPDSVTSLINFHNDALLATTSSTKFAENKFAVMAVIIIVNLKSPVLSDLDTHFLEMNVTATVQNGLRPILPQKGLFAVKIKLAPLYPLWPY